MSAFIVEPEHIHYLMTAALIDPREQSMRFMGDAHTDWTGTDASIVVTHPNWTYGELRIDNADAIAAMLYGENYHSVNCRYRQQDEPPTLPRYRRVSSWALLPPQLKTVNIVTALKAIDCYEYQSCEHAAWATSPARAFCDALRGRLICALPGYEAAPWGITSDRLAS